MLKQLVSYNFERKNISWKGSSIENIGRFEFLQRTKIAVNAASTNALMGLKLANNEHCINFFYFFNFVLICAWNLAT